MNYPPNAVFIYTYRSIALPHKKPDLDQRSSRINIMLCVQRVYKVNI